MGLRNNQILITSVVKAINKARVKGTLKTKEIAIFKLLDYYINFTQATIDNGSLLYKDINILLSDCIRKFSYQNSSVICNSKITTDPDNSIIGDGSSIVHSTTVSGKTINIGEDCNYRFTISDFTTNYYDSRNNPYSELLIYLNSLPGTFKYNNVVVTGILQISVSQVTKLTYNCADSNGFSFNIPFRIKSTLSNSSFSPIVNNLFIGTIVAAIVPPVVVGTTINIGEECSYRFTVPNFTTDYYDAGGNTYSELIIYLSSLPGTFRYNNTIVTGTLQIPVSQVINLTYKCADNDGFSFNIPFKINSVLQNSVFSTVVNNLFIGTAIAASNSPATIGDNIIYGANRVTTILTLAMFTTQLAPPYSDPENDLIDAIRIDSISTSNLGIYYLNNITITAGLIITRENLIAGVFKHVGADIDTVSSDSFTFSARDEGSQIWIN